jgi:uncharacterized Ntn-hydrolase superfamily protein
MTFSIVGYDPIQKEWGIAVQSKFLSVGAVVPFAKAGVGAVATQAHANTQYGPKALEWMEQGKTAEEALELIVKEDPDRDARQVGIVDFNGGSATFTGKHCFNWAGGEAGKYFAAQGNILVDEQTVKQMGKVFSESSGSLAERLLLALDAGQTAGGDSRGMQSAALLVVKEGGGYSGYNDRYMDLRVDDHPDPIKELMRIHDLHQLYFAETDPDQIAKIEGVVLNTLILHLERLGYRKEGQDWRESLKTYLHTENFEMRELEGDQIDLAVLRFMEQQNSK